MVPFVTIRSKVSLVEERDWSAQELRDFYDDAPCGYHALDPRGVFIRVNNVELEWIGRRRSDVIGKARFADFLAPDSVDEYWRQFALFQERGIASDVEFGLQRADGSTMWVSLYARLVRNDAGEPLYSRTTLFDITARKAAEVERDRFFDLSLDMLCIAGMDGYFKRLNPAFERTLGWSTEELLARPFIDFVHPDDREATLREVENLGLGKSVIQFVNRYSCKDGSWKWLSWVSSPAQGLIYATARDITSQRIVEAELAAARDDALRANLAKSEFLSRMSHELRTPLNAILGYGQLIELESKSAETIQLVGPILRGGRHLLALINEILDLSRIEAGKLSLSLEPTAISDLLSHALALIRPTSVANNVTIRVEANCSDAHALADRQRLLQTLINLLSNAVKYNRPEGQVTVLCETYDSDRVRILVRDTGHGIPEDAKQRLFMPFERLGAEVEGTGLGLALSRGLVEAMGGRLDLVESSDQGSTFCIDLRRAEVPSLEQIEGERGEFKQPSTLMGRSCTILLVEDNVANMSLLERVFRDWSGVKLLPAMQGSVAIAVARDLVPDLVLLDVHLPDIPGYEVLRALQIDPRTRSVPVVVLSADATESQRRRLLRLGAKAYLTKPLDLAILMKTLEHVLSEVPKDEPR